MPGHKAWWGWEELADLLGRGGRASRAGAADYSGNCQLQCLQSGSNRFPGGGRRKSLSIFVKPAFACVSPG